MPRKAKIAEWKDDLAIQEWFRKIGNKRTIKNYSVEFPKFLEFAKMTPNQILEARRKQVRSEDVREQRFFEDLVVSFKQSLEGKDKKISTVQSYLRTVMSFFSKHHVPLVFSRNELKIEPSEKDKVVKEWIPTNEEVRVLYRTAHDSRDRALLLMLYQSGFSEIDVANMNIEDFDFYDDLGNWKPKLSEHMYHARLREKTNILQQTCVSCECLEDIRITLQSRGFPNKGRLFVSFRGLPLDVREINMAVRNMVQVAFNGRIKEWQTKHLRDAYMNGLEMGKLTQEVKDAMVGHQRSGARKEYGISEQTIKAMYRDVFKFLTINGYGSTSRKIEELESKFDTQNRAMVETITRLQNQLTEIEGKIAIVKEFPDLLEQIAQQTGVVFKRHSIKKD
jgi:integrase